jgi:hypothetical protein
MKKLPWTMLACVISVGFAQSNAKPSVEVLRWGCSVDVAGIAHAFGTIKNVGPEPLNGLRAISEFFSDKNRKQLIAQSSELINARTLAPGAESAFDSAAIIKSFEACWVSFELDTGKISTKYPNGDTPPN